MSKEAMKQALKALEQVTKELLAVRDELAERGARPTTNVFHQRLWDSSFSAYTDHAIPAAQSLRQAIEQAEKQEPVAWMRMPKVGDRVVCIEDEDLGTVQSLTAGGSPDIKFDDGSYGTYLLREFAELFRYVHTHPQPKREWVGLTDEEIMAEHLETDVETYRKFKEWQAAHGI